MRRATKDRTRTPPIDVDAATMEAAIAAASAAAAEAAAAAALAMYVAAWLNNRLFISQYKRTARY